MYKHLREVERLLYSTRMEVDECSALSSLDIWNHLYVGDGRYGSQAFDNNGLPTGNHQLILDKCG